MSFRTLFSLSFITFSLLFNKAYSADENCAEPMKLAKETLKNIKAKVKSGEDINRDLPKLEILEKNFSHCNLFKNLKITDQEIASYRKIIHAPDNSYNLEEKSCNKLSVDTSNMPKNNNQGELYWCFGFSATDVISFHEKTRLSAYDVSLNHQLYRTDNYKKPEGKSWAEVGGWENDAILISIKNSKGVCLEDDFTFNEGDWFRIGEILKAMVNPKTKLSQLICEDSPEIKEIFKDISADMIKTLDKLSSEKRTAAIMDLKCGKRHVIKTNYQVHKMIAGKNTTREKNVEKIDELLSHGQPISLGYDSRMLTNGVGHVSDSVVDHVSTIIGRAFNKSTGTCDYLVKNSWGDECGGADSIRCENGIYYVPRTALRNNLRDVTWMTKEEKK